MEPFPILLIGAQKAGSSYLYSLLAQHPLVEGGKLKEPKILSKPMHEDTDYMSHFVLSPGCVAILDGSVSYLHVSGTAERAAERLGQHVRVIAVLRDPVERAVSGYLHEIKHGRELRAPNEVFGLPASVNEAIEVEDRNIHESWRRGLVQPHNPPLERYRDPLWQFRYLANSNYSQQLEPWIEKYPHLKLVDFAELCVDPEGILERLRQWLSLPEYSSVNLRVSRNGTEINFFKALRENRSLCYDHQTPAMFYAWRRLRLLSSQLKSDKPEFPYTLANSLRSEFETFKQREESRWL